MNFGNTMSNIKNGGYIVEDNNYVYYIDFNDNYSLHRYNLLNNEDIKLSDGNAMCVNVVDDWIYFCTGYPGNICRVKKDSTFINTVTFKEYYKVIVTDKYIFALESKEDEEQKLYRINLNGSKKKLIFSNVGKYYDIYNNTIYFSNGNDNYMIYACDLDGNNIKKVISRSVGDINIFDNYMYYTDIESNYIFKNNLFGTDENVIYKGFSSNMNLSNFGIVFNDKDTMYIMGLNGENLTVLNKGIFDDINSLDNLIIYKRPVQTDENESGMYVIDLYNKSELIFSIDKINEKVGNKNKTEGY